MTFCNFKTNFKLLFLYGGIDYTLIKTSNLIGTFYCIKKKNSSTNNFNTKIKINN